MNEPFESEALEYLLNEMDPRRRAAFEQRLQHDERARAALKACADSLAGFACEIAPAEPLSATDQRTSLDAILAATQTTAPTAPHHASARRWTRFLWPLAAAILIGLNLLDLERPFATGAGRTVSDRTAKTHTSTAPSPSQTAGPTETPGDSRITAGQLPAPPSSMPLATRPTDERARELERLRANVADLERAHEALRAQYEALVSRVANLATTNRELNRLSTMELVDASSYARGDRKGLVTVARGILTEPGVVTLPDPPPPPTTGSTVPAPKLPYAWSVFDEKELRGYLNLYQLPTVPAEQALHVWVRSPDTQIFQPVGEVPPQFYGGSGTVQYSLPGATSAPAEILITAEPRGATPTVPSGPTILRGP